LIIAYSGVVGKNYNNAENICQSGTQ